eukprot:TRINITY_DN11606_c0_g1_i3.p1 TRINITY_DN11606_c0_g1~~TRINITY_DN11606_c0_g1_i3.p1  ORF type:complete len:209 (-),score=60.52 TRINITY_DN11606_c0_g1_i3:164-790(-)
MYVLFSFFFFQAEDGIRDAQESRGLGDVYKRQAFLHATMQACLDSGRLLVDLTALFAFVLASIHCLSGMQATAVFLEGVLRTHAAEVEAGESKKAQNCLLLLAHMYNLKLIGCRLVYDVVIWLCESFNEESVAQILLLLKNIGFQLRSDDPAALKSLIQLAKTKAAERSLDAGQGRVHYLLEMIDDLKNNKRLKSTESIFVGERCPQS